MYVPEGDNYKLLKNWQVQFKAYLNSMYCTINITSNLILKIEAEVRVVVTKSTKYLYSGKTEHMHMHKTTGLG